MDTADDPCRACPIVRALEDERDQLLATIARLTGQPIGAVRIAHPKP